MALIEWRDSFSVGVVEVDHEHRELIDLINDAHAQLRAGGSAEAVVETLGEIHARIAAHFALEEKVMRQAGYDRLGPHKEAHEALLDEIRDIMDACEAGQAFDEATFGARLADWFGEHFRTEDAPGGGARRRTLIRGSCLSWVPRPNSPTMKFRPTPASSPARLGRSVSAFTRPPSPPARPRLAAFGLDVGRSRRRAYAFVWRTLHRV